jgi:twitching motility protein PilT
MELKELLTFARERHASDLHLSAGHSPIVRINGEITQVRVPELSSDDVLRMLHSVMSDRQKKEYEENLEIDLAIHIEGNQRYRVNAFNTMNGHAAVLRSVPPNVSSFAELGLPAAVEKLCHLRRGLILVTGPTGNGKSTTLASIVDYINQISSKHIITIEDPVEFLHTSKKSLINQREVGRHTNSFVRALRSALREDPDVIMIGEMRDIETIRLALTAAETGHLVLATLHTNSAAKTIDRIVDVFPAEEKTMVRTLLSNTLEAILSQILIKRTDKSGRIAAFEILLASNAIQNLIREGKTPQIYSLMQVGKRMGMQVMKDHIATLLEQGLINQEDANIALNIGENGGDAAGNNNTTTTTNAPINRGF